MFCVIVFAVSAAGLLQVVTEVTAAELVVGIVSVAVETIGAEVDAGAGSLKRLLLLLLVATDAVRPLNKPAGGGITGTIGRGAAGAPAGVGAAAPRFKGGGIVAEELLAALERLAA